MSWEHGKVTYVDSAQTSGEIDPDQGAVPVAFHRENVIGPMPSILHKVCFRRPNASSGIASHVMLQRSGGCGNAELAWRLGRKFMTMVGDVPLSSSAEEELLRLSRERARRIEKALDGQQVIPQAVLDSRIQLAEAAMTLMAIEAIASTGGSMLEPSHLRDALRRQRPSLPRS